MAEARRRAGRHSGFLARRRPRPLVQARRRLRRRGAPALFRPVAAARQPANCRHGKRATTARWRSSSCSTSFPATCSAATPGPMPAMRCAREVAQPRHRPRRRRADRSRACWNSSICRSCIRSICPTSLRCIELFARGRPCRKPEMAPSTTPISSGGSAAFPTATAFWAARPRRRSRPSWTQGGFSPLMTQAVNGRAPLPFSTAVNIVPASRPVYRNSRSFREN